MRALTLMLCLLVAAGCRDHLPEAVLHLPGRVITDTGEPVADLELQVTAMDCQASLGAVDPAEREHLQGVRTDAEGRYSLRLFYVQRQLKCLVITTATGPSEPGAEILLEPYSNPRGLPDLVLWQAPLIVTDNTTTGTREVEIPGSPFTGAIQTMRRWSLVDAEGRAGWETVEIDGEYRRTLPECVAEDFIVGMRGEVRGLFEVPGEFRLNAEGGEGTEVVGTTSWTGTTPLSFPGRVPISRGAACSFSGVPQEPCPVTDGQLRSVFMLDAQPGNTGGEPHRESVRLTFREDVSPRRIVVRRPGDWGPAGRVQVSADGTEWTDVEQDTPNDENWCGTVLSDPGFPVRHLRIVSQALSAPSQIQEVSVFED